VALDRLANRYGGPCVGDLERHAKIAASLISFLLPDDHLVTRPSAQTPAFRRCAFRSASLRATDPRQFPLHPYRAGSECLAAPRNRQNDPGFTRHRPPAIPIAPLQWPRFHASQPPGNSHCTPTAQSERARIQRLEPGQLKSLLTSPDSAHRAGNGIKSAPGSRGAPSAPRSHSEKCQ